MSQSQTPTPDYRWVLIAAAGFVLTLVAAGLFIAFADRLSFISNAVYYLLLMPIALGAAAFLFGAMRSRARYKGEHPVGSLQLGGPVVVFVLVLLGGVLIANPETTSRLTVRLTDQNDPTALIEDGEVYVDFGDDRRMGAVGANGQVTFTEVPRDFLAGNLNVVVRANRYRPAEPGPYRVGPGGIIDLPLVSVADSTTVAGTVSSVDGPLSGVVVNFNHGAAIATTDANGNFRVALPIEEGAVVPVTAVLDGRRIYNEEHTVSSRVGFAIQVEAPPQ